MITKEDKEAHKQEQAERSRIKKARRIGDADNKKNTKNGSSGSKPVKQQKIRKVKMPSALKSAKQPKAILRIHKIKSRKDISASSNHVMRNNPTPNANENLSNLNQVLVGTQSVLDDYLNKLGEVSDKRKNGVKLVEHMLTASPEYFRPENPENAGSYSDKRMESWKDASLTFLKKEYGENLVHVSLHLDESTPHLHAYMIPIDHDKKIEGKMNAAKWFDGKAKLSALQDRYHKALEPLGIERGVKKSKAKHQSIGEFYSAVNETDVQEPKLVGEVFKYEVEKAPFSARLNPEEYAQVEVDKALKNQHKEHEQNIKPVVAKAVQHDHAVKRADNLYQAYNKNTAKNDRKIADKVRDIPLDDVAEILGMTPNEDGDRNKWKTPNGDNITITGDQFFNHNKDSGGGGAIDLVMSAEDCDFKTARDFLAGKFTVDRVAHNSVKHEVEKAKKEIKPKELIMPESKPHNLNHVKNYLVRERKLDPRLIDDLIQSGDLYADDRKNAVFVCRDGNDIKGAEKVGTMINRPYKGVAKGSDSDKSAFVAYGRHIGDKAEKIVFVEAAIDAVSYVQLNPTHLAISTAGKKHEYIKNNLKKYLDELDSESEYSIGCGWDNADDAHAAYQEHFGDNQNVSRVVPDENNSEIKDWNELVQKLYSEADAAEAEMYIKEQEQLEIQHRKENSKWTNPDETRIIDENKKYD